MSQHFFKYHLDIDNTKLSQKCYDVLKSDLSLTTTVGDEIALYNKSRTATYNRVTTFPFANSHKETNTHTWEEFKPVADFLKTLPNFTKISKSWVGLALKGSSLGSHVHKTEHSVFIYYVNINESHPSTRFFINNEWVSFPTISGDCVYFSNSILHDVPANTGTEDRIVITVDI